MTRSFPSSAARCRAFTLIEMLVVVTIIILLMAFATPALTRTLQASRLASAGESLIGAVAEAQQVAFTSNTPVDMRFFSYKEGFDTDPVFHSYQLFKITQTSTGSGGALTIKETLVPVGNLVRLPEGIVIPPDPSLSSALSGALLEDTKEGGGTGYSGVDDAEYGAIRFMPDGSCRKVGATTTNAGITLATLTFQTLPESFFTVTFDIGAEINATNLPKNFYTIQVDPYTGKARSYKPGF